MQIDPGAFGRGLSQSYGFVNGIATDVQKNQREMARRNALSQYAMNPEDPAAGNALAGVDPETYMAAQQQRAQLQERQAKAAQQGLESRRENIVMGAKIIRQMNPQNQAGWEQAIAAAQRVGVDVSEVPREFNPQYVQGLVSTADALEKQGAPSALIQGYEYRQGLPENERPGFDRYQQNARPQIIGNAESGFSVYNPNAQQQESMPVVSDQASYDAVPEGGQYFDKNGNVRMKQGGQTQPASGNFPDDLAPR